MTDFEAAVKTARLAPTTGSVPVDSATILKINNALDMCKTALEREIGPRGLDKFPRCLGALAAIKALERGQP